MFVPPARHLSAADEKACYDLHDNQPDDPGCRRFLERLSARYDFITLSEVVEHPAEPGKELDRLWAGLAPGGRPGIMTKRVPGQQAFGTWHCITGPTHIGCFSDATFHWLAGRWSSMGSAATLVIAGNDVVSIEKGYTKDRR